jgi:hypothetical protein
VEARHDSYQDGDSICESNQKASTAGSAEGRRRGPGEGSGTDGDRGGVMGEAAMLKPLGSTGCDWRVFKPRSNGQYRNTWGQLIA